MNRDELDLMNQIVEDTYMKKEYTALPEIENTNCNKDIEED